MKSFYVARCWKGDAVTWEAWSYDKRTLIKIMKTDDLFSNNLYYVSQKTCQKIFSRNQSIQRYTQPAAVRAECERVKRTQEEMNNGE